VSADYDTYHSELTGISVQLKCGFPRELKNYIEGDHVELSDGVYIGYGGVAIIRGGILFTVLTNVYDKYGNLLDKAEIVNPGNPISKALAAIDFTDLEQMTDEDITRLVEDNEQCEELYESD